MPERVRPLLVQVSAFTIAYVDEAVGIAREIAEAVEAYAEAKAEKLALGKQVRFQR